METITDYLKEYVFPSTVNGREILEQDRKESEAINIQNKYADKMQNMQAKASEYFNLGLIGLCLAVGATTYYGNKDNYDTMPAVVEYLELKAQKNRLNTYNKWDIEKYPKEVQSDLEKAANDDKYRELAKSKMNSIIKDQSCNQFVIKYEANQETLKDTMIFTMLTAGAFITYGLTLVLRNMQKLMKQEENELKLLGGES